MPSPDTRGRITVGGSLAQKPHVGGHTWQFLQYLLGFRRLGWDVLFLDRLERGMAVDAQGAPCAPERSVNLKHLHDVMQAFDLSDAWSLAYDNGTEWFGVSRSEALARVRESAFLLNVMGFVNDEETLAASARRVFLDTDPGVGQMWKAAGLADVFRGHDVYMTIGENIGRADCRIPTCGLAWETMHQPVVLDQWPVTRASDLSFSSVATWRGGYAPIVFEGRTYGQRVHEFRKFFAIPQLTRRSFRLALDIDSRETRDLEPLRENGWDLLNPREVAGDPFRYRAFIQASAAEFSVAKQIVVDTHSGWFSDRSMCYLASGKPVLTQDTGLAGLYPTGRGLLTFSTLDEARAGVETIARDYDGHCRAARDIAEACFDSDIVLTRLLDRIGV